MPFLKLGLCKPIVKAVKDLGYTTPTPIQKKAIPLILSGKDLIATAQTGTGKTAAFVLPILERFNKERTLRGKRIRALILTPTRELSIQVAANNIKGSASLILQFKRSNFLSDKCNYIIVTFICNWNFHGSFS